MEHLVVEKKELGGKLESLLKNCFTRSWRQAEELQRIEEVQAELAQDVTYNLCVLEKRKEFLV